mgnify:FL=1
MDLLKIKHADLGFFWVQKSSSGFNKRTLLKLPTKFRAVNAFKLFEKMLLNYIKTIIYKIIVYILCIKLILQNLIQLYYTS